ncbi:MarR family transcriptional regulator [Streptomyces sp. AV19]|uniref:MarR family winged helix-turn-helix transcriptional regulator n=1 Tax=Streptomyces sp. AV19 TaxID=2793068 RepID=UPI0018FE4175|nr:MarR family transcriptional regulator [Streptomyces sp. AV19]MBH1933340.1 MarR family transcriptional regulator [Streptomyces sp. AV19]MDG4531951.1 MarR family transcriptional regulator [Streptomyces sp. AV19]
MALSSTPAPRKSPDPLTVEVVDLIGTVVVRYHEEYDEAAARHSLTGAQARVLALLAREPLPMRRIAERLKCEPSNVTGIVDRLAARGLVERRPDPADRRVKVAAVTPDGRGTAERLREGLDFAREPLSRLSPEERTTLRDLLRRMLGEAGEVGEALGEAGEAGEARDAGESGEAE